MGFLKMALIIMIPPYPVCKNNALYKMKCALSVVFIAHIINRLKITLFNKSLSFENSFQISSCRHNKNYCLIPKKKGCFCLIVNARYHGQEFLFCSFVMRSLIYNIAWKIEKAYTLSRGHTESHYAFFEQVCVSLCILCRLKTLFETFMETFMEFRDHGDHGDLCGDLLETFGQTFNRPL